MPMSSRKEYDHQRTRRAALAAGALQVLVAETDAIIPTTELVADDVPLARSEHEAVRKICTNFNRHIPECCVAGRWNERHFSAQRDDAVGAYLITVAPDAYATRR